MKAHHDPIYKESNTTAASQVQVLGFITGEANTINDGLGLIPDQIYPDNPCKDDLVPNLDKTGTVGFAAKLSSFLFPLAFITGWANTWENIKRYRNDKNKNFEKTLDLGVNITMQAVSTTILALILAGVLFVAPYLLAAMLGLGMAYGLYNIVKHSYRAYCAQKEGNKEQRNAHLGAIPLQLIVTAINALGFVANLSMAFHIGPQLTDSYNKLTQAMQHWDISGAADAINITKSAGSAFQATKFILYGLGALVTLGTIPVLTKNAFKYNQETLEALKHPVQTLKKAGAAIKGSGKNLWEAIKKRPYVAPFVIIPIALEVMSLTVQAVSRVLSLALTPVQLLGKGIIKGFNAIKNFFSKKKPTVIHDASVEPLPQSINDSTFLMNSALSQQPGKNSQVHSDEKLIATTEQRAKTPSPYLPQSFWSAKDRTKKNSQDKRIIHSAPVSPSYQRLA